MFLYDLLLLMFVDFLILYIYPSGARQLPMDVFFKQVFFGAACIFLCRFAGHIYQQVWRYSGSSAYIRLIVSDAFAGLLYYFLGSLLSVPATNFIRILSIVALNLLLALSMRLVYQYIYQYAGQKWWFGRLLRVLIRLFTGLKIEPVHVSEREQGANQVSRINIAIVGAGRVGTMLAEELLLNPQAAYQPCLFIDIDREKVGRSIYGVPVIAEEDAVEQVFAQVPIQEIVIAIPAADMDKKRSLYEHYKKFGCRMKTYDYPTTQTAEGGRRAMREFDIEELLFRAPRDFLSEEVRDYYHGKVVLITGGGGSIGSELCRQIARTGPKQLIILDIYENGAYEIQQELRMQYDAALDVRVEIANVCDAKAMERIFTTLRPEVIFHAAAHKHVPLMEHNCCEAIYNNVFGTLAVVNAAERAQVDRFLMVSTDKAVNPTNVMGATKRVCEMIVQSRVNSRTTFCATRFGNVLGSNGSVVPLFKQQIQRGGPITLTDRRIIRYFMTIPEAAQLVLRCGAMARRGELYALDMGKPVKILELAESMIRLSGMEPYKDIDIVETGLRPGEKLYEELLIKTEELDKTENEMIFVERDEPLSLLEIDRKLDELQRALDAGDNDGARECLMRVVPTYRDPGQVNAEAQQAEEMRMAGARG